MKWNANVAIFRTSPEIRKVCCKLIKSWKKTGSFIPGYCTHPGSSVGSVRSEGPEVAGSIPGHDISKSLKMILATFRLPLPIYEIVTCKPAPVGTGIAGIQWCLNAEFFFTSSLPPQSVLILDFNCQIFFFIYLSGYEQDILQDCNSGRYLNWILFPVVHA